MHHHLHIALEQCIPSGSSQSIYSGHSLTLPTTYLKQQQISTSLIRDNVGLVKCVNKYYNFFYMKHITPDMSEADITFLRKARHQGSNDHHPTYYQCTISDHQFTTAALYTLPSMFVRHCAAARVCAKRGM